MLFRAFRSGHGAKTSLARQLGFQTACEAMLCKNNQPVRDFCLKSAAPNGCEVYFGKNGQNQTQSEHTLRHFWPLALKSAVRYARRLGSGLRGGPSGPTNLRRPVGLPPRFVFKNGPRASGGDRCAISRCRFFRSLSSTETDPPIFFCSQNEWPVASWTGRFSIELLHVFNRKQKGWSVVEACCWEVVMWCM